MLHCMHLCVCVGLSIVLICTVVQSHDIGPVCAVWTSLAGIRRQTTACFCLVATGIAHDLEVTHDRACQQIVRRIQDLDQQPYMSVCIA
jgi:hypothetical protein